MHLLQTVGTWTSDREVFSSLSKYEYRSDMAYAAHITRVAYDDRGWSSQPHQRRHARMGLTL